MDFNSKTNGHASDFYLSYLEEQVRSEMGDSTARITQTTQGRISIDIQEDVLEDFLNELHAPKGNKNNWSQERKDMLREMHSLKAQLKEAQAKYELLSEETGDLKSKMGKICTMLRQTQRDLKQQTCDSKEKLDQMKEENEALQNKINKLDQMKEENEALQNKINELDQMKEENKALQNKINELDQMKEENEDLQNKMDKLDQMKEENETLRSELEAMKLELRMEKHLRTVAENNAEVKAHSLNVQLFDKDTAEFEARSKAEQLEADLAFEKTQAQRLQAKLSKVEQAFVKHKEEAKKSVEQSQASYRTQQEELRKISLALKKAESLLETKQVCLEQKTSLLETISKAKAFYISQLDEQKQRNNILVAAQESVEKKFESERVEWQKERSSLIQANECLTETLQDKEEEWEENKTIMTTHIEGLHTYAVLKMKKKKKWWKKLF